MRQHRVTWESSLRREAAPGQEEAAEFELTLLGRCPGGHVPVDSDVYALVFERLRSMALHALEPVPDARYSIDPFDAAVHLRAEEGWAPEVELGIGTSFRAGATLPAAGRPGWASRAGCSVWDRPACAVPVG